VLFGERVIERQHRHRMPDFCEPPRRRRADPLGQALQGAQLRKTVLDRAVAPPQRVIGGIGHARSVVLIVAPVVPGDLGLKPRVLGLGLFLREVVDGKLRGIFCGHLRIRHSGAGRRPEPGIHNHRSRVLCTTFIYWQAINMAHCTLGSPATSWAASSNIKLASSGALPAAIMSTYLSGSNVTTTP